MTNEDTITINMFGPPGTGKSAVAAGLFYFMKSRHISCELVTEYAKEAYWEERATMFGDQIYLLAKQHRRLSRLQGKVKYVIMDSPIMLGAAYEPKGYFKSYVPLLAEIHNSLNNVNFMLYRNEEYDPAGRNQTESESNELGLKIKNILSDHKIVCQHLPVDRDTIYRIFDCLNAEKVCPKCSKLFRPLPLQNLLSLPDAQYTKICSKCFCDSLATFFEQVGPRLEAS